MPSWRVADNAVGCERGAEPGDLLVLSSQTREGLDVERRRLPGNYERHGSEADIGRMRKSR